VFLILLTVAPVQAEEDISHYIGALEKKYERLQDYSADVTVHFDLETFKAPDMQGRLYYKRPDKMKVESKKIFFFPKEGAYFNPALLKRENFEITLMEHLMLNARNAVRLRVTPRKTKMLNQGFILTIDPDRQLIREIEITQAGGREIKAVIAYGEFAGFDLPTRIQVSIDIPMPDSHPPTEYDQFVPKEKRVKGTIDLSYANYRVNSGIRDEIFQKK